MLQNKEKLCLLLRWVNEYKNYLYKKAFDFHRLTDEIYNYKIKRHYKFYGYCPLFQEEFYGKLYVKKASEAQNQEDEE